ncbi:uncharacterized protein [Haliotis cracherodii]|uniref:uncharacterized protein n=1 Tax=Haliotis cracherodii TaxID=6455 RepID=UPI0039ED33FD
MAFHVRLSNHNLFKLSKIRALPFATQADDKVFERRQADPSTEHVYKTCPASVCKKASLHDKHLYMTKLQQNTVRSKSSEDKSRSLHSDTLSSLLLSVYNIGFQDGEKFSQNCQCGSRSCLCPSDQGTRSLEGRKACLPEISLENGFLPMTLTDLENLFQGHSKSNVVEKAENQCIAEFVKAVSYSEDDILAFESNKNRSQGMSRDIISHENHDVTVLQDNVSHMNTVNISCQSLPDVHTVFCDGAGDEANKGQGQGPSEEQLLVVHNFFERTLPDFLKSKQDYRIYHKDIIFENNYFGKNVSTQGITAYVTQVTKIRILTHFMYAHAQFSVLKITHHPEDGTVRIRWRISGLPQLKTLLIWKFMPWNYRKNRDANSEWHDGFSIFTVGSDGFVHKHRVDRVMKDEELQMAKPASLAARLSIMLGLAPKPSLNDFSSLFLKRTSFAPK